MAIGANGVAQAELTLCAERDNFGDRRDGNFQLKETRLLPWAFVRFGGDGEDRYVMPMNGFKITETTDAQVAQTEDVIGNRVWQRIYLEYMPFRAFPLESQRPLVNGPGDEGVLGQVAVHFFGGV